MATRSAPREIAFLNKLHHLSVMPRRQIHLRQFDFSRYPVLCWYHGVIRRGSSYSLQCDVQADGSVIVTLPGSRCSGSLRSVPKPKRFRGQLAC